jgi:hypothetical protein
VNRHLLAGFISGDPRFADSHPEEALPLADALIAQWDDLEAMSINADDAMHWQPAPIVDYQ